MDIKREIHEFLVSRRARVSPEQAGLIDVNKGDRRVPGLRREEVATLAGISIDYYIRLERGKIGGASEGVLQAIARVLKLDNSERTYLFNLAAAASHRKSSSSRNVAVSAPVQHVLDSMSVPAVVQNDNLDVLSANALGRALYVGPYNMSEDSPNLARFIFLDPAAVSFYVDYDLAKNLAVAMLRSAVGHTPLDQSLINLIVELSAKSRCFSTLWAKHDVYKHSTGRKLLNHPIVGELDLSFNDFALPSNPTVSICTFTTTAGTPTANRLKMLSSWVETQ